MLRLQQCDKPFTSIMATLQGLLFSCLVWSPAATAVTPTLNNIGSYTVTLTLANGDADTFQLNVIEPIQGLAERPMLTASLSFPVRGSVDTGNYSYESAFPNLEDKFVAPVMVENDGLNQNLIYVVDKPGQLYVFPNHATVAQNEVVALLDTDFHEEVLDHHEHRKDGPRLFGMGRGSFGNSHGSSEISGF